MSKLPGKRWYITVISHASLKSLPGDDERCVMAWLIYLSEGFTVGNRSKCNLLSWGCKKTQRVAVSTFEAETIALNNALDEGIEIKKICQMTNIPETLITLEAYTDCNDTAAAIRTTKQSQNLNNSTKREIARIKEHIAEGRVQTINWIGTDFMLADCMTKLASKIALAQTNHQGKFYF